MKAYLIGKTIINRIESENTIKVQQKAKGYASVNFSNNEEKIFWLVEGSLKKGHRSIRNIVGDIVNVVPTDMPYLNAGGVVVSKNTPFGNALAELPGGTGQITYKTEGRIITATVLNKADYNLSLLGDDAIEGEIICEGEEALYFETSLKEKLAELYSLLEKEKAKENLSDNAALLIQNEIDALKKEIDDRTKKAKRYRRTTASIRQKFLLDIEQNKIKRTKLFNGPLVINGGPGTGKTTLLIHRIQYMLDPEVENDENFTINFSYDDKAQLRNQKTGWLFFTPTDLLKKYLENAMTAEGLEAHDDTVKTWEQQRVSLKTALGLFNTETGRPFQAFSDKESLWRITPLQLSHLLDSFDDLFINHLLRRINKLSQLNRTHFSWRSEGEEIIRALGLLGKNATISNAITVLNDLALRFSEFSISNDKKYKELMDRIVGNIQGSLKSEDRDWIINILRENRTKKTDIRNEDDEREGEELIEAFEDEELIEGKRLEIDINKLIRKVLRNAALDEIDDSTKINNSDKAVLNRIKEYYSEEVLVDIGALALFTKYFKPFLKGSDSVILNLLPRIYKSFRRENLLNVEWLSNDTKEKLKLIISTQPTNTRVHEDELDFIILNALRYARIFFLTSPNTFHNSNNPTIKTFANYMKGLIAVDEATDFTAIQICCMYQLAIPRLNSITLCGDIMQQMNVDGIDSWEGLEHILPHLEIRSLVKSYRQTPRLLELAIKLHENRYGFAPKFESAEKPNEDDPYPLVFIDDNFDNKTDWICKRIIELFSVYENVIPNIAIFVKDYQSIISLADSFNNNELLIKHGIKVKPCIGEGEIGSAEFVRIFDVKLIKGMEFESVFFIDVDEYDESEIEILDKVIYVGLSRATYYLAITLKKDFPSQLQSIKHLFKTGNWSKDNYSDY